MCDECVSNEFPDDTPIKAEKPKRQWPDPDKDPPKGDPEEDRDDRIHCKG